MENNHYRNNQIAYRSCQVIAVALVVIAFIMGVVISNPPQSVTPQNGSVSPVDSKLTPTTASPTPSSSALSSLNSQAMFMMAYERRGETQKMVLAQLTLGDKGLEIEPVPQSDEFQLLGTRMATIGLVPMNRSGMFQWLTLNLRENNHFLFRTSPNLGVTGLELTFAGTRDIAMEGEKILALVNDKFVTIEDNKKPMFQPLPGGGTLSRMFQVHQEGKLVGTYFTQIGDTPHRGNYVFYKPSNRAELMLTPLYIFPQSMASLGDKTYIFGIDKNRQFKMLDLNISSTDGEVVRSTTLGMKSPPNSIGVGHAFVHTHPDSGARMASLLMWDDPNLRRFDVVTGAELSPTALNMFTAGIGSGHEARQSVQLKHKDRHSAFTMQSLDDQGKPTASLVVGHGKTWKTMNVRGTTNGLTANGRWLVWDVRNTESGADQVLFLDLDGEMNEFSGSLVLGKSNPGTEMPSFLAINTR